MSFIDLNRHSQPINREPTKSHVTSGHNVSAGHNFAQVSPMTIHGAFGDIDLDLDIDIDTGIDIDIDYRL